MLKTMKVLFIISHCMLVLMIGMCFTMLQKQCNDIDITSVKGLMYLGLASITIALALAFYLESSGHFKSAKELDEEKWKMHKARIRREKLLNQLEAQL